MADRLASKLILQHTLAHLSVNLTWINSLDMANHYLHFTSS